MPIRSSERARETPGMIIAFKKPWIRAHFLSITFTRSVTQSTYPRPRKTFLHVRTVFRTQDKLFQQL
jgi:hypothetical protein